MEEPSARVYPIPFDSAVQDLLESRRAELEANPESVVTWEEAKKQLRAR